MLAAVAFGLLELYGVDLAVDDDQAMATAVCFMAFWVGFLAWSFVIDGGRASRRGRW